MTELFYVQSSLFMMGIFMLGYSIRLVMGFLLAGNQAPTRALIAELRSAFAADDRMAHAFHGLVLFTVIVVMFGTIKSSIPGFNQFSWDEYFLTLDQTIFLGTDPYKITDVLFGGTYQIVVLNFFYNMWVLFMIATMTYVAWMRDRRLKLRFMFASMFGWLIAGNILAIAFSSAGPCFLELLNGNPHYLPLMNLLNEVNDETGMVWALTAQKILWTAYETNGGQISGISAMPSMHVLNAVLLVYLFRDFSGLMRWASVLFAIIIFIGSIQLSWHYAVDSIAGAMLAVVFWHASAPLVRLSLRGSEALATARCT